MIYLVIDGLNNSKNVTQIVTLETLLVWESRKRTNESRKLVTYKQP